MSKIVIFGNSGSGKSTLAKTLAASQNLAHLDLDTIAWKPVSPPVRMSIEESNVQLFDFIDHHKDWVIEGCYADLLSLVLPYADEMFFLNLPVSACIENAKNRPWEPHKYESEAAQNDNLAMLIDWIALYPSRTDTFSQQAHENLYKQFDGKKTMFTTNV